MARVGRAIEKDETKGFIKVFADPSTRRILGAAILGTDGDEAIHGILDAMNADVPWPAAICRRQRRVTSGRRGICRRRWPAASGRGRYDAAIDYLGSASRQR